MGPQIAVKATEQEVERVKNLSQLAYYLGLIKDPTISSYVRFCLSLGEERCREEYMKVFKEEVEVAPSANGVQKEG